MDWMDVIWIAIGLVVLLVVFGTAYLRYKNEKSVFERITGEKLDD